MKKRSVRQSQVLHPYGPGAILDLGQESFVMLDTDFNKSNWRMSRTIRLPRLEARLKVNKFQSPPDNSTDKHTALQVQRFPSWLFCPTCREMVKWSRKKEMESAEKKQDAPECLNSSCKGSILVPMRYVAACKNGHLSDVDWWLLAHSNNRAQCDRTEPKLKFKTKGSGSSLSSLVVECLKCRCQSDLGDLQKPHTSKKIGQQCSGKQIWQARDQREECKETLKYLLRSETAVHFSDIQSALDLDIDSDDQFNELDKFINKKLKENPVLGVLEVDIISDALEPLISQEFDVLYSTEEIKKCISGIKNTKAEVSIESDPEEEEWKRLCQPTSGDSKVLKIRETGWRQVSQKSALHELVEDVLIVERLREVRAFTSFSRVEPMASGEGNRILPNGKRPTRENQPDWFPAVEVFGEVIFFKLSNERIVAWEKENAKELRHRQAKIKEKVSNPENWVHLRYGNLQNILPKFYLVHTFAHALMRQLSFNCGYNLASIREKLFVFEDKAGILLYTAQGDSEGSLGGLVRQGEIDLSGKLITQAIERLVWCSNDPICSEMPDNGLEGLNKSACHACAIVPETSCTHLNTFLDRNLVINYDCGDTLLKGYFNPLLNGD